MDALDNIFGLVAVAGAAIYGRGMLRMRVTFDGCMTSGAAEAPVDAGLLLRLVHIHTMAHLVLQGLLAMTGKALSVLLRWNCWNSEAEQKYGR